ncbi:MAG: hypothetical protein WCD81_06680 [Candidatus Bathyarchaeia archaeon]
MEESEEKIGEELIYVIFYVLDASRLACPSVNLDETFMKKLEKNTGDGTSTAKGTAAYDALQ